MPHSTMVSPALCKHCGHPRGNHARTCRHLRLPLMERFWMCVDKSGYCWNWNGYHHGFGYGLLRVNGKVTLTHRLSWELHYGTIPSGMEVCHTCDNPACVRPDHLFLGTHHDNMMDMMHKGRAGTRQCPERRVYGEKHPRAKLTEQQVHTIRQEHGQNRRVTELATKYGVSKATIQRIVSYKGWAHTD